MRPKPILLIQAGTPPDDIRRREGDLPDWFHAALGRHPDTVDVIRIFEGEPLPPPGTHPVAIITGSWAMVTDQLEWSETTADWIRRAMAVSMPLFGVCYGHQLMSHALGGHVGYHPAGLEIGCQRIELLPAAALDPLTGSLPPYFSAHLTHLQTILELPPGATVLARSAHDPHQIVRYGPHVISTQFHPEFTPNISAACVMRRADMLRDRGHDPEMVLANLQDTPVARTILQQFVQTYSSSSL